MNDDTDPIPEATPPRSAAEADDRDADALARFFRGILRVPGRGRAYRRGPKDKKPAESTAQAQGEQS